MFPKKRHKILFEKIFHSSFGKWPAFNIKNQRLRIFTFSLCFLLPTLAFSQGIQDSIFLIKPLRVTHSKIYKKEAAGMREIKLDSAVLREQVMQSLTGLLAENTLVHLKDYGRGAMSTVSFRGAAASHTQVSWNGMNINSPMLGMVDFSVIPVFILDEVSLKNSAASISSQGGALGGLIQLENKADWQNKRSGRFYQDIGSFGTINEFAQLNVGNNKLQSKTRFYHNYSANDYEFTNHKILEIDQITGEIFHPKQKNSDASYRKSGFSQELYWRAFEKSTVEAQLWYQDAKRAIPTVHSSEFYGEAGQLKNQQDDHTLRASAQMKHYGKGLNSALRTGYNHQKMGYYTQTMLSDGASYKAVNSGIISTTIYSFAEAEWKQLEKLTIQSNASFNWHDATTRDTTSQSGYDVSIPEISVFGGAYYTPIEQIQLAGQLRKEWFDEDASPLIYTLGLSFKPFHDYDLVMKGNFSKNYHHPTLNDLYWQPGGNPDLLPEEGYTGEISIQLQKKNHLLDFSIELTAFKSDINNWIIWLPGLKGYWVPENIQNVSSQGIEYSFQTKYIFRKTVVKTNGNISFSHTLNSANKEQLPFIPKVNGNLFISVKNSGYYVKYLYRAIGNRKLVFYGGVANEELLNNTSNFYTLYPHILNKVSIGKSLKLKHFDLALELRIMNLFDEEYRNILQRFMPGRNYLLSLKLDF